MFKEFYRMYLQWSDEHNLHKVSESLFSRRVFGTKGKPGMLAVHEKLVSKLGGQEGLMYTLPGLETCRRHFEEHVVHGRLEWSELPVEEVVSTYDIPRNVVRLLHPPGVRPETGDEGPKSEEPDSTPNPRTVDSKEG